MPLHLQPVMHEVTDTNNELRLMPSHPQPVMHGVKDTNNELRLHPTRHSVTWGVTMSSDWCTYTSNQ